MFKVKKIPLTANTLWDAENGKPLCKFSNGVIETNDVELVEKLKGLGYEVTGEPDNGTGDESVAPDDADPNTDNVEPLDNDSDTEQGDEPDNGTAEKSKRRSRKAADK